MNIWLDVTTIWGWRRPALGIVRVEAEMARHFVQVERSLVRFCRYDQDAKSYLEVLREEVVEVLQKLDDGWQECRPSGPVHFPAGTIEHPQVARPSRQDLWKQRARNTINRLPPWSRVVVFRWVKHGYHTIMKVSARMFDARSGRTRPSGLGVEHAECKDDLQCKLPAPRRHPFETSDVYISLGLDWDQKDLTFLYGLKSRLRLRIVLCCYDVIPILMPDMCVSGVPEKFPRYFADVAWCADEVVCISNCSRLDLTRYLESVGAPIPKMSVIRLGSELPSSQGAPAAPNVDEVLKQPFILYVSTIEARKNHKILYDAYKKLLRDGTTDIPRLIWVGMRGWGVDRMLADLDADSRMSKHIEILNHVSDDDLRRLYESAMFTVYPSLYEGWGLPVAESLAYGKFCLASSAASIPEVGASLIEYADPYDVDTWASRLLWYFQNPGQVKEKESEIVASYRNTSWRETGDAVLSVARRLANA